MHDVFISYSHNDRPFAEQLEKRLSADGISVWIDYKSVEWGQSFPAAIEEGLDACRHIICLMSPSWTSSAWSQVERYSGMVADPNAFLGKLLPILVMQNTDVPRFMRPLSHIDCSKADSFDREYPRIRDHILKKRAAVGASSDEPLRFLDGGGTHLPPLRYVFVVGHPGAGKSTFARVLQKYGMQRGYSVDKRSDYLFLQALYRLDMARRDFRRFDPDAKSEFHVKDVSVYDDALKLIHEEIVSASIVDRSLRIVEFSRSHYDSSFLYYTMRGLVNSAIVHVDAPLDVCETRNDSRREALEKRLAGVEVPGDAFDFDSDTHYVPPAVYTRYRRDLKEWTDQALALALMPARAYLPVENHRADVNDYKRRCEQLIADALWHLVETPERISTFYARRMNALEAFVSRTTNTRR